MCVRTRRVDHVASMILFSEVLIRHDLPILRVILRVFLVDDKHLAVAPQLLKAVFGRLEAEHAALASLPKHKPEGRVRDDAAIKRDILSATGQHGNDAHEHISPSLHDERNAVAGLNAERGELP